jgi:endonuclease/exonuclease/phosphatase (EEP) superfamily protein YafD
LPHAHVAPSDDDFGIAIYSRDPLIDCRFVDLAGTSIKAVVATTNVSGKQVRIVGAHPPPPLSSSSAAVRIPQLQQLASLAAEHSGPTIVTGDLNTSSWSPYFGKLLRDGELRDTRRGFGLLTSHSSCYFVRITIDHVLVSEHLWRWGFGACLGRFQRPTGAGEQLPSGSSLCEWHCHFRTIDRWVTPCAGSDHDAVVADLAF